MRAVLMPLLSVVTIGSVTALTQPNAPDLVNTNIGEQTTIGAVLSVTNANARNVNVYAVVDGGERRLIGSVNSHKDESFALLDELAMSESTVEIRAYLVGTKIGVKSGQLRLRQTNEIALRIAANAEQSSIKIR